MTVSEAYCKVPVLLDTSLYRPSGYPAYATRVYQWVGGVVATLGSAQAESEIPLP